MAVSVEIVLPSTLLLCPTWELGRDTAICDDLTLVLQPQFTQGTISWFDGSLGDTYTVKEAGIISATLNNDGCEVRDSIRVTFEDCLRFNVYIPNAFSPNNDGINDSFAPQFDPDLEILDYSLQVYNRWGDQLFETENRNEPWQGRFRGKLLNVDAFVYVLNVRYRDDFGERSKVLSGEVMLLR